MKKITIKTKPREIGELNVYYLNESDETIASLNRKENGKEYELLFHIPELSHIEIYVSDQMKAYAEMEKVLSENGYDITNKRFNL